MERKKKCFFLELKALVCEEVRISVWIILQQLNKKSLFRHTRPYWIENANKIMIFWELCVFSCTFESKLNCLENVMHLRQLFIWGQHFQSTDQYEKSPKKKKMLQKTIVLYKFPHFVGVSESTIQKSREISQKSVAAYSIGKNGPWCIASWTMSFEITG